jgi:hypothetical protein
MENKDYVARSEKGLEFDRAKANFEKTLLRTPEALRGDIDAMNASLRQLALTPGSVSTTPVLQQFAVAYQNDEYIGTRVFPVQNTVTDLGQDDGALAADYWKKNKEDSFAEDGDDAVGTRGAVSEVDEGFTKTGITLTRRAKKEFVDAWTQAAMDSPLRLLFNPLLTVANRLAIKQERRLATAAQSSANFGTNYTTLTGSDQWLSGGGDPAAVIDTAKAAMFHNSGVAKLVIATSRPVYNILKRHPQVLDAFKYTAGGMVRREQLAEYFEVDEFLVGAAKYNSAKEGLTPVYSNIWANSLGVYSVSTLKGFNKIGFGVSIESPRFQTSWYENGTGGRGGFWTQIALADTQHIVAGDAGYLVLTPIG